MSELKLLRTLAENKIDSNDIKAIEKFSSRDGFVVVDNEDFDVMMDYFKDFPIYEDLIPVMTDNNSNYLCLYIDGPMKGMVCNLQHDDIDLSPKFRSLSTLITIIEAYPDAYEVDELDETDKCDFPKLKETAQDPHDEEIVRRLYDAFNVETEEQSRQQLAFCIMSLTAHAKLDTLYPLFDHDDMYIQERAIFTMGVHRHKPALEKLIELQATAQHNGKTAAKYAIKKIMSE